MVAQTDVQPFRPKLSVKQTLAWETIHRPEVDELLYGGAKGGAKSVFLCYWMYLSAYDLARRYVAKPRRHPIPVGWLGRRVAKHFKETTLDTWKRFIPGSYYRLKGDPPDIIIGDRVLIRTGGLDSQESLEKFNSAEFALIGMDQAEETTRDDVAVLRASRRLVIGETPIPAKIVWTANPRADSWLREDFVDHTSPSKVFIAALYTDNPWLPANYVDVLEESFSHRPDLLRAYRDGDWTALSGIDQVILEEWITAAKTRYGREPYEKRWLSVDPARFGDDSCVILGGRNTEIIDARVLPSCPEPQIVSEVEAMAERMGDCEAERVPIVVEVVGVCGVGDYLRRAGRSVIEYCPSAAAADSDHHYNARAETWSTVAKWLAGGLFDARVGGVFRLPEPEDEKLRLVWQQVCRQLTWPWYEFRGQKILIAAKEAIKKAHSGVSPDYGDAYVNGVSHLSRIRAVGSPGLEYQRDGRRRRGRPAVLSRMGF